MFIVYSRLHSDSTCMSYPEKNGHFDKEEEKEKKMSGEENEETPTQGHIADQLEQLATQLTDLINDARQDEAIEARLQGIRATIAALQIALENGDLAVTFHLLLFLSFFI